MFSEATPMTAVEFLNERQFKELGFEVQSTEAFFKQAILSQKL